MRTRATFLAGLAVGYVLGARAGRARYEQIRQAARSFATNPTVQSTASHVQHQAGEALSTAKDKASGAIGERLHDKRPSWLSHRSHPSGGTRSHDTGRVAGSNGHASG